MAGERLQNSATPIPTIQSRSVTPCSALSQSLPMKKFQRPHRLFLLCSFICFLSCLALVSSRCPEHQKSALLNLFSDHSSLLSWKADGFDCCEWEGITCDDAFGHVVALDLSARYFSSSINSSALASLGSLRFLNLSYNDFGSSMLPSNLDCLSNLSHLNLSHSRFAGQIPAAIARMTNLVVLDLSESYSLKLADPSMEVLLRNLPRLTKLHLDGVNISSGVPDFLSNFTDLTSLSLVECNLVGEFPASIFQMPNLETLDVSWNRRLNGSFPDFPRESALRTLILSGTGFSGSLPYSFRSLRNLTKLDLSVCEFFGPITSLNGLTELEYLGLSGNDFSGQIPSLLNLTRLAVLELSDNSFSSSIPELDSLKNITKIDISFNNLTGEIPKSTGDGLRKLVLLNLGNNSLHGKIPLYLFTLPCLRWLHLYQNQLDGELHEFVNASSTLEEIYLNYNRLQGQIPLSIFGFRRLQELDLSSNRFNGSVNLAMLQRINSLRYLDLSHNSLVVNASVDGSSFPQLQYLYLSSCNLKQFPDFLRSQSNMKLLDLSNNKIVGEIPSWMWNVGGGYLEHLNLSENFLTSLQQPYNLSSNSFLKTLDLHSNHLQGEIPLPPSSIVVLDYSKNSFTSTMSSEFTSTLGHVEFFSISDNNVSGEIPSSICDASSLQVLDLSNNSLRASIPNCLSNLKALKVLNLKNNQLTGIIPNISSEKCVLRTLNLNGNQLEGKMPESLSNCIDLEVLDVGNNRLGGLFPYYQNILSNLRVLVLRSNNFGGSLSQLCNISAPLLQIIDMSSNNFSGSLPPNCFSGLNALMSGEGGKDAGLQQQVIRYTGEITGVYFQDTVMVISKGLQLELVKILTIYKSLDLSNNKLVGETPREIGALKLLRVLNMSHNYLTGQIPASIGNARQLESLDLSRNQLSGRIPSQLSSLTFLEVLNLSYNQLVGSIPTGPQFSTFTNDSFIGNLKLCGLPLSRKCENSSAPEEQGSAPKEQDLGFGSTVNWLLISVQLGYTVGLAIVFGPLLFCRKWRMWYFKQVDMQLAHLQERWYRFLGRWSSHI